MLPVATLVLAACGGAAARRSPSAPEPLAGAAPPSTASPALPAPADATGAARAEPALPPPVALLAGLMPLASTGVEQFRSLHPSYDGRGVLIAILDSGIDPGVAGLITTSTGAPKIADLRDFSGEGRVALSPVAPAGGGTVAVAGAQLLGAGRIGRLASAATWYAGTFRELPLGRPPAADVNGNGTNTDVFPLVVVRASDGWVVFIDSNLNGSFEDEMPLHDYRQGRETIALGTKPLTIAANFAEVGGAPLLDLYFDTSGHGTHVAGIAAGHNLFNVAGFHGVAPGAQLVGLKIANNARGGLAVHGSMRRAMEYAAQFAAQRNLPLVLNLSFGVGNEREGRAVIDSVVDAFLEAHPDIAFTISAGNDGPGLSTMGFPGSADLALSIGATFPGPFTPLVHPEARGARDVPGWWSSRGGEVAKPDLLTPGLAFSSVPPWNTGGEIKSGTSMAAPHAAGLVACLLSAMGQEHRRVSAAEVMQALRVSATSLPGAGPADQGAGVPQLEAAYRWLTAGHQGSVYVVRATSGGSAAFRRDGLAGPGDTLELFRVRHAGGLRAARFLLRADVPWLAVPEQVTAAARVTEIPATYRASALKSPGRHVGTVTAWNPNDTLAGPLFALVNTVIVPHELAAKPLYDERRRIGPASVQRYFLRVAAPGSTLRITVTLPDSPPQFAAIRLYEPTGQPSRAAPEDVSVGWCESGGVWPSCDQEGTAQVVVRSEDLVPGVYELDVLTPPLSGVTATVRAELGPVALAPGASGGELEASNAASAGVVVRARHALVGVERLFEVTGRGLPAESLAVRVPAWAARAEIDVRMPPEQWDEFTDFGVTVFDSMGQQVSQGPLNYAFGRQGFDVPDSPAGRERALTVELFPCYALPARARAWRATVRVRFLLPAARPFGDERDVAVVAGGRARLPAGAAPALELPEGFRPLVEARARAATGVGESVMRYVVDGRD